MPKNWTKAELARKAIRDAEKARKAEANQNPLNLLNPENQDSNYGDTSNEVIENIQPQGESFAARAASKLNAANESIEKKRGRPPKDVKEDSTSEFANLLSSVIVIVFAFTNFTEDLKPNADETGTVSLHLAKIIMRHVDISGKLTGDALDAIGIIAVCSTYYARVAPALRAMKESKGQPATVEPGIYDNRNQAQANDPRAVQPVTPIQEASPLVKNWLDNQADSRGVE